MSGASDRRSVAVRIAGNEYKLRSDGDEEGLIRIAGYVDQAMSRVRDRTGTVDSLDVAVLTCLNLAREILALHGQRAGSAPDDRLRGLIERVESVIGGHRRAETSAATAEGSPMLPVEAPRARTLELPSMETLRDRQGSLPLPEAAQGRETRSEVPVRVAAGGRDRVG